jgi:hypothetical protein
MQLVFLSLPVIQWLQSIAAPAESVARRQYATRALSESGGVFPVFGYQTLFSRQTLLAKHIRFACIEPCRGEKCQAWAKKVSDCNGFC